MRAYFDSDVLIWHLRGANQAEGFFYNFSKKKEFSLWIGAMQRAEIVFFMRPDEESATELFLSQFNTASVDQSIIDQAGKLFRQWNPSHGIDINDAILAATAMQTGGKIYCLNTKHYPFDNIIVQRAW